MGVINSKRGKSRTSNTPMTQQRSSKDETIVQEIRETAKNYWSDSSSLESESESDTDTTKERKLTSAEYEINAASKTSENVEAANNDSTANDLQDKGNHDDVRTREPERVSDDILRPKSEKNIAGSATDYPISEAEKMLQLYKKERSFSHLSANVNRKDKTKHRAQTQYRISNIHETNSGRLCNPSKIESDMVVHPSTSNIKTNREAAHIAPMTKHVPVETSDSVKPMTGQRNVIQDLTKSVLEERSTYSKEAVLKPLGVRNSGGDKMKLWLELVEQRIVLPEQWSELNHKQEEAMSELVSEGILKRKPPVENDYTMSIGTPSRRPPPRLNQIPPIEKPKREITDFFSAKIPGITTDTLSKHNDDNTAIETVTTSVIAVSEANQKVMNVGELNRKDGILKPNGKPAAEPFGTKRKTIEDILGSSDQTSVLKSSSKFVDKEISTNREKPTVQFSVNKEGMSENGTKASQKESEYFDALNGERYSEVEKRKMRLWDMDMV